MPLFVKINDSRETYVALNEEERHDLWALLYNFLSNYVPGKDPTIDPMGTEMVKKLQRLETFLRPE